MKKISFFVLTFVMLMFGAVQTVSADNWPIKIGGFQVTDDNHKDPLGNGQLEVSYSKSDKMYTVKVIPYDYKYVDTYTDHPWAEFTGASDHTLRVCISWHDTITTKGPCIKSTGNVRIRRAFSQFYSYQTHYLQLYSNEAECVNCAGNFSTKDLMRLNFDSPNATAVVMNGKFTFGPHEESQIVGKPYAFQGITKFENEEQNLKDESLISHNWKSYLRNDELYSVEVANNRLVRKNDKSGQTEEVAFATIDYRSQDRLKEPDQDQIYNLFIDGHRVTRYNCMNVLHPEDGVGGPVTVKPTQWVWKLTGSELIKKDEHSFEIYLDNCQISSNGQDAAIWCEEKGATIVVIPNGEVTINAGDAIAAIKTASCENLYFQAANVDNQDHLTINSGTGDNSHCIWADGEVKFKTVLHCDIIQQSSNGYDFAGNAIYYLNGGVRITSPDNRHFASESVSGIGKVKYNDEEDKLQFLGIIGGFEREMIWSKPSFRAKNGVENDCTTIYVTGRRATYGISVKGVGVTSNNCKDILGDGKWSFDTATYVLHVADNTSLYTDNDAVVITENHPFTIEFGKNCLIQSNYGDAIWQHTSSQDLTLQGQSAKLIGLNSSAVSSNDDGHVTIAMDSLYAEGGYWGIYSRDLNVISSGVRAKGGSGAIGSFVDFENCYAVESSSVKVINKEITDGQGKYAKDVSIVKGVQPWNIRINGDRITPANASDVLGDGKVQFYPGMGPNGEDLLVMNAATIQSLSVPSSTSGAKEVKNLYIEVAGICKITNNITFYGSGLEIAAIVRTDGSARGEYVGSFTTSSIAMNGTHGSLIINAPSTITNGSQSAGIKVPGPLSVLAPLTVDGMTTAINAESMSVAENLFVANQYTFNATQAGYVNASGTLQKKVEFMDKNVLNDLLVGGFTVSPTNYTDILGDGTMWFEPNTATLHLKNVNVTKEKTKLAFIHSSYGNMTIVFEGNNTITSSGPAIAFYRGKMNIVGDQTNTGYNRLVCQTTDTTAEGAIIFGDELNISKIEHPRNKDMVDSVIVIGATAGITSRKAGVITMCDYMTLEVSGATKSGLDNVRAVTVPESIKMRPLEVIHNTADGNLVDKITLQPYAKKVVYQNKFWEWDLYIAGRQVNEMNWDDLGEGITFDHVDQLTLNNANIDGDEYAGIQFGKDRNYTLRMQGENTITSVNGNAIVTENALGIYNGKLTLHSDSTIALYAKGSKLSLVGVDLTVTNGGVQGVLRDTVSTPSLKQSSLYMTNSTLTSLGGQCPSLAGFNYLDISQPQYKLYAPSDATYVCDLESEEPFAGVCVNNEITKQTVKIGIPTGIDEINATITTDGDCRKIIRNGQLYIIRGGVVYSATGQRLETAK